MFENILFVRKNKCVKNIVLSFHTGTWAQLFSSFA